MKKLISKNIIKSVVAFLLSKTIGVYGGIKPPIKSGRFYAFRRIFWKIKNKIYCWSGLPDRWRAWYLKS